MFAAGCSRPLPLSGCLGGARTRTPFKKLVQYHWPISIINICRNSLSLHQSDECIFDDDHYYCSSDHDRQHAFLSNKIEKFDASLLSCYVKTIGVTLLCEERFIVALSSLLFIHLSSLTDWLTECLTRCGQNTLGVFNSLLLNNSIIFFFISLFN